MKNYIEKNNKDTKNMGKILHDVSFISTVFNEEKSILPFLDSFLEQSVFPSEITIVDGGSRDNTFILIENFFKNNFKVPEVKVNLLMEEGASISKGRNIAIAGSGGKIICASDAGCVLDRNWLQEITLPYNSDTEKPDVVGGMNYPVCGSFLQKMLAACIMPMLKEINTAKFMPSSRNISFKKEVWQKLKGYPEYMDFGEDMKFNFMIKNNGYKIKFNPDARVYWKMREGILKIFKQFFRYAKGDAVGRMYFYRHIIRFAAAAFFLMIILLSVYFTPWILTAFIPSFFFYILKPLKRIFTLKSYNSDYKKDPGNDRYTGSGCDFKFKWFEKISAVFALPVIMAVIDCGKMCGYIYGLFYRKL